MVSASRTKGEGELDVAETHERLSRPASKEAGEQPQDPPDDGGQQHGAEADEERDARAVEHARERVAPELICAEGMPRRPRRLEALAEIPLDGVVRRQYRGGERRQQCQHREREAEPTEPIAPERRAAHSATSRRVRGSSQP